MKRSELIVAILILAIIMLIIVPLSPAFLDVLLILSLALALLILLIALYMKETLEFSTYPTMLLLVTLFRLVLNISATRLILGNGGNAGQVIKTFGSFVVGSNLVVGFVIFIIIVLIQFIVITKGAERVSEVAARFTLDAMPGKQMAIDADLGAGLIDEETARQRRSDIMREADFYGAMDGASKFVKGDAILGIIITFVNIVGGIVIGLLGVGGTAMTFDKVIQVYMLATVGNGLVSQLPALMVSTATGIIVTRSANESTFGESLVSQLLGRPGVLILVGGMLAITSFIPGIPTLLVLALAAILLFVGYSNLNKAKKAVEESLVDTAEQTALESRRPESVTSLLQVDLIEMEFGYGLLALVDDSQGGDLLDRVVMIRRQCAMDLGIIVPVVHLRDNIQLPTNDYSIKIRGLEVSRGEVLPGHYLALKPAELDQEAIEGIETKEPAYGMPALWILDQNKEKAELMGYTVIDAPSMIATHLMETIKRHASELLSRQQVQTLLDHLREREPALVEEVVPKMFSIGEVQKVLAFLLDEHISIRDLATILETLGDHGATVREPDQLAEYVRQSLKRAITQRFSQNGRLQVITLDPALEQTIADSIKRSDQGQFIALEPSLLQKIMLSLKNAAERAVSLGVTPVVLTEPQIRRHIKRITEQISRDMVVLSYNELEQDVEVYSDGVVKI